MPSQVQFQAEFQFVRIHNAREIVFRTETVPQNGRTQNEKTRRKESEKILRQENQMKQQTRQD